MALDRQSIERRDFPISRRGYEPDAVDAHLETLAEGVEAIRASARRRSERLAAAASEQVRSIVEAAESSAYELQRRAESEARDARREARLDADRTHRQSREQARELVAHVEAASSRLLGQLDEVEREQSALVDSLRSGGRRLRSELETLERALAEEERPTPARADVSAPAQVPFQEEPPPPFAAPDPVLDEPRDDAPSVFTEPPAAPEPEYAEPPMEHAVEDHVSAPEPEPVAPVPPPAGPEPHVAPASEPPAEADGESERLIALNMVLNGSPREETERYLNENFGHADRGAMLQDLYASLGS